MSCFRWRKDDLGLVTLYHSYYKWSIYPPICDFLGISSLPVYTDIYFLVLNSHKILYFPASIICFSFFCVRSFCLIYSFISVIICDRFSSYMLHCTNCLLASHLPLGILLIVLDIFLDLVAHFEYVSAFRCFSISLYLRFCFALLLLLYGFSSSCFCFSMRMLRFASASLCFCLACVGKQDIYWIGFVSSFGFYRHQISKRSTSGYWMFRALVEYSFVLLSRSSDRTINFKTSKNHA